MRDRALLGRELRKLGYDVRLMPPSYVKAYLKRQKNDAADAEAICEAVTRPSMRFVPIKSPGAAKRHVDPPGAADGDAPARPTGERDPWASRRVWHSGANRAR